MWQHPALVGRIHTVVQPQLMHRRQALSAAPSLSWGPDRLRDVQYLPIVIEKCKLMMNLNPGAD